MTSGLGFNAHIRATATGPSAQTGFEIGPIVLAWAPFAALPQPLPPMKTFSVTEGATLSSP